MDTLNWEITCVPDRMTFHHTTEEGVQIGTCKLFISELCVFSRARTPVFMCTQMYMHGVKRGQPLVSFLRTSTLFLYLVLFLNYGYECVSVRELGAHDCRSQWRSEVCLISLVPESCLI